MLRSTAAAAACMATAFSNRDTEQACLK
jgi:hypothetical protein